MVYTWYRIIFIYWGYLWHIPPLGGNSFGKSCSCVERRNKWKRQWCFIHNLDKCLLSCVLFNLAILLVFCFLTLQNRDTNSSFSLHSQKLSNLVQTKHLVHYLSCVKFRTSSRFTFTKLTKLFSLILFTVIDTLKNSCYEDNVELNSFLYSLPWWQGYDASYFKVGSFAVLICIIWVYNKF